MQMPEAVLFEGQYHSLRGGGGTDFPVLDQSYHQTNAQANDNSKNSNKPQREGEPVFWAAILSKMSSFEWKNKSFKKTGQWELYMGEKQEKRETAYERA